jgi:hypothetical protein
MSVAYLAPPKPISLLSLVEPGPSKQPGLDLEWDNFQAYVESFLNAVSANPLSPCTVSLLPVNTKT